MNFKLNFNYNPKLSNYYSIFEFIRLKSEKFFLITKKKLLIS
jgi:hypothetical protein